MWLCTAAEAGVALEATPMPTTIATNAIARRQFNLRMTCLSLALGVNGQSNGAGHPHPTETDAPHLGLTRNGGNPNPPTGS